MPISDHEYINFSEDTELNYVLKKYGKKQSEKNRDMLKKLGNACKKERSARMLKHAEFYPFLEKYLDDLES